MYLKEEDERKLADHGLGNRHCFGPRRTTDSTAYTSATAAAASVAVASQAKAHDRLLKIDPAWCGRVRRGEKRKGQNRRFDSGCGWNRRVLDIKGNATRAFRI